VLQDKSMIGFRRSTVKLIRRHLLTAVVLALVGAWVLPLQASSLLLSYSGDAYNDGNGPASGAWWGVASYNYANTLEGTVDYVVFAPGKFQQAFPGSSYSPSPTELVYAYQTVNTGSSDASTLQVAIADGHPADTIGSFSLGDSTQVTPSTVDFQSLGPGFSNSAYWLFQSPTIPSGGLSVGLAYASPDTPEQQFGSLINSGLASVADPLPAPSTSPVPEPSTLILLVATAIVLGLGRRFMCKQE
jgi:hypothetical protein